DLDWIFALCGDRLRACLRQLQLDPRLVDERGRNHEEDEQEQHDVDQRRQIELRLITSVSQKIHRRRLQAALSTCCASIASTSLIASFSICTTSPSTLPRRYL